MPRFALANSAIRCRFVDRFAGSRIPSCFIPTVLSRGASLSSLGSRRARFPDVIGTYEGATTSHLRMPVPLWFRSRVPRTPPLFVSAEALPMTAEVIIGPGIVVQPASQAPAFSVRGRKRDLSCSLAIHPMPLPGSQTPAGSTGPRPFCGPDDAAPGVPKPKAPARRISRLNPGLWHLLPTLREERHRPRARLASGWRAAPLPGGCRTLW